MSTGIRPSAGLPPAAPERPPGGWTAGRIAAVFAGAILALVSLGLLGGGAAMMWADQAMRNDAYLTTGTSTYSTGGYALASQPLELGWGWLVTGLIGDIRVRVTPVSPGQPVFVAIGPADQVMAYLSGVSHATITNAGEGGLVSHYGTARPAPPRTMRIWAAQVSGTDSQMLRWVPRTGTWMVVVLNPDGSAGLDVRADAGVSAPWLFQLAVELIIGGIMTGALSAALIVVPVRLAAGER